MSSGPKTRGSYGPTSPRGQYRRSMAAPGMSLDMPDKVVKKAKGGSVKKLARGGIPNDMMSPAQRALPVRQRDFYKPRDYLANPNRRMTEQEMFDRARINADERAKQAVRNKLAKDAARSAALKTVGKVAARAIPGLGAALTAYDVGKYAYNKYQQNQARKKPTVTVEQVPDSGAPPAPSRGGGGGMGVTSGGAMARGMPTSSLPEKRGTVTVEETEDTGMRRGGRVKKMAGGGMASKRADGIAQRGKTRGRIV